jgi:hypothetical protein
MYDVTFYLKKGLSFTVVVSEFITKRNGLGDLVGLEWTGARLDLPNLKFIRVEEVSAVVSAQRSGQVPDDEPGETEVV